MAPSGCGGIYIFDVRVNEIKNIARIIAVQSKYELGILALSSIPACTRPPNYT